jgi:hypothetical protein
MPHLSIRYAHRHAHHPPPPPPPPHHQPTNHRAEYTQWNQHNLVDNAMNSPLREYLTAYPYFPTHPVALLWCPYCDADDPRIVLGFILFFAAGAVFLSRRRMRNGISRILSQAIEAANVPSLHIHIHGQSSSSDYISVPDSPTSPISSPSSPSTQYPP